MWPIFLQHRHRHLSKDDIEGIQLLQFNALTGQLSNTCHLWQPKNSSALLHCTPRYHQVLHGKRSVWILSDLLKDISWQWMLNKVDEGTSDLMNYLAFTLIFSFTGCHCQSVVLSASENYWERRSYAGLSRVWQHPRRYYSTLTFRGGH